METPDPVRGLEEQVRLKPLPHHVGVIMDGNGRWAEKRGLTRVQGHREGSTSVREVTRCARRLGIQALTLYAFSSQNWSRPADEVAALMDLLVEYLEKEREELLRNGIRMNLIGEIERLPRGVREPMFRVREESARNSAMVLTLALSYGGREEILRASRTLAERAAQGTLSAAKLDEATFESCLWTSGLPPLDLVIRTGGERRLSNFLLWQAAYAELVFLDTLWPDMRAEQFLRCVEEFQNRERRFGLTGAQIRTIDTVR
ncbi:MAG TPA: polyprenyl diphosphate synthase [Myxococcaceae bacterium]|nr:polyprenyl diphosphate synthase [Myxococcaceae bacterium]